MAADRSLTLSARAAAAGLIDFSKSRFDDVTWWRRFRLILDGLKDQIDLDYAQFAHQHAVALVGCAPSKELQIQFLKDAGEQFQNVLKLTYPWLNMAAIDKQNNEAVASEYKKFVGDMDDPDYRRQVDLMVEELNNRRMSSIQTAREKEDALRKLSQLKIDSRKRGRS